MNKCQNIFYSTGCLIGSLDDRIKQWKLEGKNNIEISFPFYHERVSEYLNYQKEKYNLRFLIHNYLAFDRYEFVLNLGSLNSDIYTRSLQTAKSAIKLTNILGEKYYSLHAPFLFDPVISKLGKTFQNQKLYSKDLVLDRFNDGVYELERFARELEVELLFENNVLTRENYEAFQDNPLIFSSLKDINEVLSIFDQHKVGILLDTGHLCVSAETLKFERYEFAEKCGHRVRGLHISSNDGYSDQNKMPRKFDMYERKLIEKVDFVSFEVSIESYQKGT